MVNHRNRAVMRICSVPRATRDNAGKTTEIPVSSHTTTGMSQVTDYLKQEAKNNEMKSHRELAITQAEIIKQIQ